jgi:pimeloyl-ACP methyl ester carboxylesterase
VEHVRTGDGRSLRVVSDGDPDGVPVLTHHGTPGAGSLYRPHAESARGLGIRLLGYDRPGYGDSSPAPGRTIASCAADVETIADALGLERLAISGISGGGPHALACGALLGDRVVGVAALASIAPAHADGLDWTAGMGAENVAELDAAARGREALAPLVDAMRAEMLAVEPENLGDTIRTLLAPVDAAVLTGEFAESLYRSVHHALRDGAEGWVEDDLAFAADWGFEVSTIEVPVLLWHGDQDEEVPLAHARWLAERIPGASLEIVEGAGHLMIGRVGPVAAALAAGSTTPRTA